MTVPQVTEDVSSKLGKRCMLHESNTTKLGSLAGLPGSMVLKGDQINVGCLTCLVGSTAAAEPGAVTLAQRLSLPAAAKPGRCCSLLSTGAVLCSG